MRLRTFLFVGLLLAGQQLPGISAEGISNTKLPELQREFRGVWVATVANIDWPSKRGLPVKEQQEELLQILKRSKELNFNAIILQVRPTCDTLYPSTIEPWSEFLTGEMGKAPEPFYDPLEFAVEQSHKLGLELHAWFNPYRVSINASRLHASSNHVSQTHPELVRTYGKHLWLDPGMKAGQDYSLSVVLDIVRRYNVDGMHVDDYFYPYREKGPDGKILDFPDDESWTAYTSSGGTLNREDWRRENVNIFIERCYKLIKSEKPWVKFGISPFGIWQPGHPEQIKGFNAYTDIYCDSLKWFTNGWCDYISPQLYWKIEAPQQSYPVLLKWWADNNPKERHLWPGNFTSRAPGQWPIEEIFNQIKVTREQSGAGGNIHFSMKSILHNRGNISDGLLSGVYTKPAVVPSSPWLDSSTPEKPHLSVKRKRKELRLEWESQEKGRIWQWVLQKRVGNEWFTEIYPASQKSQIIKKEDNSALPDVVAIMALNRCGVASAPAIFENER